MSDHAQAVWSGAAEIAYCPTHGLHGERGRCFVCDKPCAQVTMIPLDPMLDLVSALADALETREDAQDPLHDAADEALLAEADGLLRRHGRER
jgi:hypothetical protein